MERTSSAVIAVFYDAHNVEYTDEIFNKSVEWSSRSTRLLNEVKALPIEKGRFPKSY